MKQEPIVIGHRGARGHVIENSLPSVQKALDLNSDGIEIDVFKIADGTIVVFHDDTVDRLTDATGPIEKYTKKELDTLTLEGGVKIPTLEEVLDLMDKKAMLNIELKGSGTAKDVNRIVKKYIAEKGWKLSDFLISSFKWDELEEMREVNDDIAIGILTSEDPVEALEVADELNAVAIHPNYKKLTAENVKKIQEEDLKVYVWTVNKPSDIKTMKSFGVDGIITDFPERVQ
ncbi:glycerophosphodiester phosphodiesterase family protein [Galbibacter sp. EGI 63066]|nr:glycerophosphodiester phosphodiesterase family protein [Galbibacter sp. EGI 63066]